MDDSGGDDEDLLSDETKVDGPVEAEILQEDGSQLLYTQAAVKGSLAPSQAKSVPIIRKLNKRRRIPETMTDIMDKRAMERNVILKRIMSEEDDSVDLFFRSIASSVKKMPPDFINEAKFKTLQIVSELESRMWQYNRNITSPDTPSVISNQSSGSYKTYPAVSPSNNIHDVHTDQNAYNNTITGNLTSPNQSENYVSHSFNILSHNNLTQM